MHAMMDRSPAMHAMACCAQSGCCGGWAPVGPPHKQRYLAYRSGGADGSGRQDAAGTGGPPAAAAAACSAAGELLSQAGLVGLGTAVPAGNLGLPRSTVRQQLFQALVARIANGDLLRVE
jgi:hypothetical protein